jgi:hypothetical protein
MKYGTLWLEKNMVFCETSIELEKILCSVHYWLCSIEHGLLRKEIMISFCFKGLLEYVLHGSSLGQFNKFVWVLYVATSCLFIQSNN